MNVKKRVTSNDSWSIFTFECSTGPQKEQPIRLDFFLKNRYNYPHCSGIQHHCDTYGGYGVTVNTEVCGAFDSGSIPDSRPRKRVPSGTFFVGGYSRQIILPASGIESRNDAALPRVRQGRERHNFNERSEHEISRLLTELRGSRPE